MNNDKRAIILDTQSLIIVTVGLYDHAKLQKIKYKDRKFTKEDFDLLSQYLYGLRIIVSPQILAETCNIVENSFGRELFKKYMEAILFFLRDGIIEIYTKKEELISVPAITKFGFSDISLFSISDAENIIISGDFPFFNFCTSERKNVIYLDQILAPKWFKQ